MSTPQIQQDSYGVVFTSVIKDQDGVVVNLSSATAITFIFERPDGTLLTTVGSLSTDGTDGKAKYVLQSGDIGMVGLWKYQTRITFTSSSFYSSVSKFKVASNLPV